MQQPQAIIFDLDGVLTDTSEYHYRAWKHLADDEKIPYSLLYLTGYDLSLDDLKQFRQWGSKTPGHPEYHETPGVEVTTGPLGQGFTHGVGMALAERWLAKHYNRPGHDTINHHTYAIVSDGEMQEGVTSEAASLAGWWLSSK